MRKICLPLYVAILSIGAPIASYAAIIPDIGGISLGMNAADAKAKFSDENHKIQEVVVPKPYYPANGFEGATQVMATTPDNTDSWSLLIINGKVAFIRHIQQFLQGKEPNAADVQASAASKFGPNFSGTLGGVEEWHYDKNGQGIAPSVSCPSLVAGAAPYVPFIDKSGQLLGMPTSLSPNDRAVIAAAEEARLKGSSSNISLSPPITVNDVSGPRTCAALVDIVIYKEPGTLVTRRLIEDEADTDAMVSQINVQKQAAAKAVNDDAEAAKNNKPQL